MTDSEHNRIHERVDRNKDLIQQVDKDSIQRDHKTDTRIERIAVNVENLTNVTNKLCTSVDKLTIHAGDYEEAHSIALDARALSGSNSATLAPIKIDFDKREKEKADSKRNWKGIGFKILGGVLLITIGAIFHYFAFRLGFVLP